jgi:hypothetical protein
MYPDPCLLLERKGNKAAGNNRGLKVINMQLIDPV